MTGRTFNLDGRRLRGIFLRAFGACSLLCRLNGFPAVQCLVILDSLLRCSRLMKENRGVSVSNYLYGSRTRKGQGVAVD